jgi:probable rRNA maturation factor
LIARFRREYAVPPEAVVEVTIAGDELLEELNREYRGLSEPTDVLAFPIGRDPAEPEDVWLWGEVYVSADRARQQATERNASEEDELCALVAHGLLHLAGFEHDTEDAYAEMEKEAEKLAAENE